MFVRTNTSRILENAGGRGAKMKVAERRLNATGEVQNFSSLTNSDERLRRLENANILECSLAEISRLEQAEKDKKAEEEKEEYETMIPKAIRKYLAADRQVDDLTCKELRAIALCVYSEKISKAKKKGEHVSMLKRIIASDPNKMSAAEARASSESVQRDEDDEEEEKGDDDDNNSGSNSSDDGAEDGEEYCGMRVAHRHVENRARICYGTVKEGGYRGNVLHWTVQFDETDAAVHDGPDGVTRDDLEDFNLQELEEMLELYEELKDNDPNPQ